MPEWYAAASAAWSATLGSTAFTIGSTAVTWAQVAMAAYTVGSAIDARQRARFQARAARNQYLSSFSDRGIMVRSGVSPRTSVYGRDMKSGVLVDAFTTGDKGQYLHVLVALSGRQSAAIEKVYFNEFDAGPIDSDGFIRSGQFVRRKVNTGKHYEALSGVTGGTVTITLPQAADRITSVTYGTPATETGSGSPIISVPLGVITSYTHTPGSNTVTLTGRESITITYEWDDITPLVRVHKFLGAPGQTVPSDLITESGGRRSAAHTGQGITWMWVRLEWDSTVFGQIGMPTIKGLVKGNLLWDPRTSTTAWSDNSALCTADYARDTELGLGCTAAQVPDDELMVEANICDEAVALDNPASGPPRTQPRYTTNGTITAGDSRIANYDTLLDAMAGHAVWVQGRWRIRAGAHPTPEPITITADSLADGAVQIQPRASRRELVNAVAATYREPAQLWADAAAPVVVNGTYQAEDGGRRITRQVPMPMVQDPMRAQRLAKIILERGRQALTLQMECNWRAYNLLPGQVVPVQLAEYGWTTPKLFEVRRRDLDLARKTVRYLVRETAAAVWDWAYGDATTVDPAPNTQLPNPMAAPPALTGLAIVSGTAQLLRAADNTLLTRAKLTWNQSTDVFVVQGGTVEIQWQPVNGTQWQSEPPVPGDSTSAYVSPVRDGSMVLFRVRAVNTIGRPSAWATQVHLVLGQTEPPSDVAGLTSSVAGGVIPWRWTPCPDLDYDVTEVRSADSNWGAASPAPLFRGRVSEWQENVSATGTYTRYFRHFDLGGRSSTTTATRSQVVGSGDLGGGGGGAAAVSLVLNPAAATLQANVDGVVTDFGPGRSVATVVQSDGTDVTSAWTFTKVDTGVVSTLSGTLGNIVTVTGYDPAGVATSWANVVLQVHCNGSWADSSRYGRTINNINPGTTFASGAPFTGAYSGRQVARYVTDQWSWCNNVFGPDPSIRKTGGPWSVRCRVRFSALPSILTTFSFCGSSFFGSFKATRVGSALNLSYVWNGSTGSPVNLTTTGAPATTGVWYALEFSYGADGHCRFFVDGVLIQTTSTPDLTRRDDITVAQAPLSQYFSIGTAYIQDPGFTGNCMLGDICDVQLINGSGGHVAAYTLESYPLPDGPYVPYATVEVTAHKAGSADIAKLFEITTIQPPPRTVTCAFSPAALVLAGDEDGNVASITSYAATVQVLVDNALDTTGYAISALQYSAAGITATISGQTVTMSAWPSSLASGNITATLVRSGYPTKQAVLNISRTQRPRRAQTQQLDKTVMLIAGETGGKVPSASYTGATVSMTVALGGVDDTANWAFSRSASTGLTTVISGNTVTLTNITDTVDSGTIDITATRTGWATTTLRCTVTKTRLLPPTGVAPPANQLNVLADTTSSSASAEIQVLPDGTIASVINGGSATVIDNWFKPTTSSVGASYWAMAERIGGLPVSSGTLGTWQQINATRSWARSAVSPIALQQTLLRIHIASDSAGTTRLGSFTVLLQLLDTTTI